MKVKKIHKFKNQKAVLFETRTAVLIERLVNTEWQDKVLSRVHKLKIFERFGGYHVRIQIPNNRNESRESLGKVSCGLALGVAGGCRKEVMKCEHS